MIERVCFRGNDLCQAIYPLIARTRHGKSIEIHSTFMPRGNDLCVQKAVTLADEFRPSTQSVVNSYDRPT